MGAFRGQSLRRLFRQSPEELVLAVVLYVLPSFVPNTKYIMLTLVNPTA